MKLFYVIERGSMRRIYFLGAILLGCIVLLIGTQIQREKDFDRTWRELKGLRLEIENRVYISAGECHKK